MISRRKTKKNNVPIDFIRNVKSVQEGIMPNLTHNLSWNFKDAFDAETEFRQYQQNALTIFALSLYLRLDDIDEFAANAITEGPNDKKIDICHLDLSENRAVIAQSYLSQTWGKTAAPANKATELNTAIVWLLSANESRIPPHLKTKAIDLRRALINGDIKRVEICYVHNCHESINVENELRVTADATRDMIKTLVSDNETSVIVAYKEFGLEAIEDLYKSRDSEILIDGWIDIPVTNHVEEQGDGWRAILTTVSGEWIQALHRQHSERLFSANYRDYLGSTRKKGNINYEITQTAESESDNFWVYNNGITALTHEIELAPQPRIRGISIINGAQTSGSLSEASETSTKTAKVLIRFVECSSRELIDKIIRYNNTQNEIRPADRRSNDSIQKRLREDFSKYGISYIHRRSTSRTPRNAITAAAIAPALCAFHGEPQIAYRNAKEIFNSDEIYERVFTKKISAEHVFLVRVLSSALDKVKTELKAKVSAENATQLEERQYEILKYSASKHFLFYIVGALTEEIMNRKVSDRFEWKCKPGVMSPENVSMQNAWIDALRALLPHIATIVEQQGKDAFYDVPRSADQSKNVARQLKALIASLESVLGMQFDEVRQRTSI